MKNHRLRRIGIAPLLGTGAALSGSLAFQKAGLPRGWAVLASSLATFGALSAKELWLDERYSQGDQVANATGILLNAGVMFSFDF